MTLIVIVIIIISLENEWMRVQLAANGIDREQGGCCSGKQHVH